MTKAADQNADPKPVRCASTDAAAGRWIGLSRHTTRVSGEQSNGRLSVIETMASPGDGPPPHRHLNEDEVIQIVAGRFLFLTDVDEWELSPGDLVYIPQGSLHGIRNVGDADGITLTFYTPGGLDQYFSLAGSVERETPTSGLPASIGRAISLAPEHGVKLEGPPPQ